MEPKQQQCLRRAEGEGGGGRGRDGEGERRGRGKSRRGVDGLRGMHGFGRGRSAWR